MWHIYDITTTVQPRTTGENSIPAPDLAVIDSKLDDGNAIMGTVRAVGHTEATFLELNRDVGSGCVDSVDNSKYLITSTAKFPCSMAMLLLSQTGQSGI